MFPTLSPRLSTGLLMLAAGLLFLRGIGWGLPNTNGWHGDSLTHYTLRALADGFAGFTKYPPLHHLVLAAVFAPYLGWLWLTGDLDPSAGSLEAALGEPLQAMTVLILLTRLVSVAMALGTVWLLARIARRAAGGGRAGEAAAWTAGLAFALNAESVLFAKLAMVDVPMTFWLTVATAAYLRLREEESPRRAALLGVLVALAVTTKEQAAGAFVLPALALLLPPLPGGRWRVIGAGLLAFALTYGLVSKLFLDPAGWAARLGTWLGEGTDPELWGGHPASLAGYRDFGLELLGRLGASWGLAATLVVALLAAAGLALGGRTARLTALIGASYLLCTLAPLRYLMGRFTLPLAVVLALLAGLGLAGLLRAKDTRLAWLAPALLAALAMPRAWAIGDAMAADPRYAAEAHLTEALPPGTTVEVYADDQYLPRLERVGLRPLHLRGAALERAAFQARRPAAVLLAPASHWKLGPDELAFLGWLRTRSGYREVPFEPDPRFAWLPREEYTALQPPLRLLLRP